jgi:hypothetical protein
MGGRPRLTEGTRAVMFTVKLPRPDAEELVSAAASQGVTQSALMRDALRAHLDRIARKARRTDAA